MSKTYGYVRVSSADQNEERQLIALRQQHVHPTRVYVDKQSGKDFNRPAYLEMISALQPGDVVYVLSIDRLGRNYEEIQQQWRRLTREIGADICVLDMPLLDTRRSKDLLGTFVADLVLQVLSFAAQHERTSIRARQEQGIAAAKARGVHMGRPRISAPAGFEEAVSAWQQGRIGLDEAASRCGMSRSTFYRARQERSAAQAGP